MRLLQILKTHLYDNEHDSTYDYGIGRSLFWNFSNALERWHSHTHNHKFSKKDKSEQNISDTPEGNDTLPDTQETTSFTMTYQESHAGYKNSVGYYTIADDGTIQSTQIAFENIKAEQKGASIEMSTTADSLQNVGVFIIANGFNKNGKFSDIDLSDGALEFVYKLGKGSERAANINDKAKDIDLVFTSSDGQEIVLKGDVFHSMADGSSSRLNIDKKDHAQTETTETEEGNKTQYNFEDLRGLGDKDYNDAVIEITSKTSKPDDEQPPVNEAPSAFDDIINAYVGNTIAGNVLEDNGNGADSDPEGETISVTAQSLTTANGQEIVLNEDGSFTVTVTGDYIGDDEFSYTITDEAGNIASATVHLSVLSNEIYGTINNDDIAGTELNEVIYGDAGQDTIRANGGNDIVHAGANADTVFGGDGDDILYGETASDTLYGEAGNDTLYGGDSFDALNGGTGDDTLYGGNFEDRLNGDEGNDRLFGEDGNDGLNGGSGNDYMFGGDGDDQMVGEDGDDEMHGDAGNDRLSGSFGNDTLYGGDGDDGLNGNEDDDILFGGDGDDQLVGESGNDELHGGNGKDLISGDDGNDSLYGDAGNDDLRGGNGDDYIYGGDGRDNIRGGTGNDTIIGGSGRDTLYGDEGSDTFVFLSSDEDGFSQIWDFENGPDGDRIDISDLLSQYDSTTDAISDFVYTRAHGDGTVIRVDADGAGAEESFSSVLWLRTAGFTGSAEDMVDDGNLII